MEEWRYSSTHS